MHAHPGIGRYIRELVTRLPPMDSSDELIFMAGKDFFSRFPSISGHKRRVLGSGIYSLSEQLELPVRARGLKLLHVPHFNIPLLFSGRLAVTVHDLTYWHDAGASRSALGQPYAGALFKAIQKKAAAVITVSEATKQDLLTQFPGFDPRRVLVIYEAASSIFNPIPDPAQAARLRQQHSLAAPYVLFVGSLKAHKNIPRLIQAMSLVRGRGLPHELVLVGRSDARSRDLLRLVSEHTFVRYLGEVPDEELVSLYQAADLFVMPSLREGFGLPLLEAMACGTPCISSNLSSLPEILGPDGLYFDPHRVDGLSELIYNVLQNRELRNKMSAQVLGRAKQFSWEHTARRTWEVYRHILG